MTLVYSWLELWDEEATITVDGALLALHGCRDLELQRGTQYTIRLERSHSGIGPWVCSSMAHRPGSLVTVPEGLRQRLLDVVARETTRIASATVTA